LYMRFARESVRTALAGSPVTLVVGPRQSGKSTLAKQLVEEGLADTYLTLDDVRTYAAVAADPQGFVSSRTDRVVIDEVQRVPEVFRAIKLSVDRDRRPGRFLLTGSADVLHLPVLSDSLAGRMFIVPLLPLSQAEVDGAPGGFVDGVFSDGPMRCPDGVTDRADLAQRIARGGFPPSVVASDESARTMWADAYLTTIVERDVPRLADISDRLAIPRLLGVVAARRMGLLNLADLARALEMNRVTVERYLSLLQLAYLVRMVPAFSGDIARRLIKAPKPMLIDTGLLVYLMGVGEARLLDDPNTFGPVLENFVATELLKQLSLPPRKAELLHFRTREREVDLVLESRDGRVVGVEVKASESPGRSDWRGLEALRDLLGERFHRGVLLHTGSAAVPHGDRMWALPVDSLWRLEAPSA
jgi:predicted AAA+ superfamily ATPase